MATRLRPAADRYDAVACEPSDIRDHLPRLRREARGTVLELGVRDGNSTAALLAGVEEHGGAVWSVDVVEACRDVFAGHPQWHFVLADSRDAGALAAAGLPAEFDVLFVDTIHTYEQVRDELAIWGDRVRDGGVILFHDTETIPELRRAIREWCRSRHVPFEFLSGSNGLGVAHPCGGRLRATWFAVRRGARATMRFARRIRRRIGRMLR